MSDSGQALRCVAAQLNFWVGDVEGNVRKVLQAAARARDELKADLIVFPELCLIGYPPDDLLLRTAMPSAIDAGLRTLLQEIRGIAVIVGLPEYTADGIFNAAYVLRDGHVVARYHKQLLPNYGVFDEKRHFRPGCETTATFEHLGRHIGVCICEDIWGADPAAQAKASGAELVVNINASPFDLYKTAARREVFAQRTRETGLPIFYVNMVGGQDELIFDGDSTGINADGSLGFHAPIFEEGLYCADFCDGRFSGEISPVASDERRIYQGLVQAIRDYVDRNGFRGALVGLSGGIDSALVAALATDALGPERVWAISMPSRYTLDISNDDAQEQALALGIRYDRVAIEPAFQAFNHSLSPLFEGRETDITEENLQSRCRGVLLMALSNKFGYIVLTTGNKSEMAVGYATLYGDMCGGFAPIKDVYKTWVYRLARERNRMGAAIPERVLIRAPSAELRPDQKDSDSLPPYEELDPILEAYVENSLSIPEIVDMGFPLATVQRVAALVRRSEYKRRQAPPGPKVTPRAFGRERRYPLTAVYGDL